jgi:hypothetical protein
MPKRRFYLIPFYSLEKYFFWLRRRAYHSFIKKYINITPETYNQGCPFNVGHYDVVLIGSDQVWNKKLTSGFDDVYWGDFNVDGHARKVAWSVCMNNTNLDKPDIDYIKEKILNFDAISVREDSLQTLISSFTEKPVYHTLDPTMLIPSNKWELLCCNIKDSGYIAVYAVRKEEETIKFAQQLAYSLGKKLVVIRSYSQWYFDSSNKEFLGPADFLSYIKSADFVVTSSFHGTVFSLIFKRQFVCPMLEKNVRIRSLLNSVGLESRCVHSVSEVTALKPIDYAIVEKSMEELAKESLNFVNKEIIHTNNE